MTRFAELPDTFATGVVIVKILHFSDASGPTMKRRTGNPTSKCLAALFSVGIVGVVVSLPSAYATDTASAEQLAFFETKIRPVLAEKCYQCHSVDSEKLKGGLKVDSKASLLHGGDIGPAIEPGDTDASLLIEAIRYGDPDLEMPPKGKLTDDVVADFEKWVAMGAAWPDEPEPVGADGKLSVQPFDLEKRRAEHWSWQPIKTPAPPVVANSSWPSAGLDHFILAKLEAKHLSPAADAAPATWLRRVYFDLIGLPPTTDELAAFEKATTADADAARTQVVDQLLASPHFGERWARHWMDLARYAETAGHEFDYPIDHAHKYRGYLIRAFNADLPFDDFVREHIAGDQLAEPRRRPATATNESILATGFWFLDESVHAPTDVRQWQADHIDNRIDALTRGFLGLTVSCARCHDHKFDAIPTTDYYALSGYLQSSRRTDHPLDPGGKIAAATAELKKLHQQATQIISHSKPKPETSPSAPLRTGETRIAADGWFAEGAAFTDLGASTWIPEDADQLSPPAAIAHSGQLTARAEGALRSPTFELTQANIHLRLKTSLAPKNLIVRAVIDSFDMNLVHTLLFKGSILRDQQLDTKGEYRWLTMTGDLDKYLGHRVYLEVLDRGDSWIAIDQVLLSADKSAPQENHSASDRNLEIAELPSGLQELTERYHTLTKNFPRPDYAIAMIDGTPQDEHVFIRGSHKTLGDLVPRRFLAALDGGKQTAPADRSGRLELAEQMLADDNPLTSRVIVNRLWHHLFGRGIVPSVDDFGVMGQPPSHPQLLDHLATRFRTEQNWSIQAALRSIVLSRTYRMSSTSNPANDKNQLADTDPENQLLHRAPIRRLQAEAIRDAMLVVSGTLDPSIGGPSVPVHLTSFMEGRGRPKKSGPLDGNKRRSVYLEVRRNFLNPMMLAFDMPSPFSAMGRRSVSNVPAQSLVLMNDPLVLELAAAWATQLTASSDRDHLTLAFRQAFAREPDASEVERLISFVEASPDRKSAWRDLCHVLFNKKEFIYLR